MAVEKTFFANLIIWSQQKSPFRLTEEAVLVIIYLSETTLIGTFATT